jgi:hypothetical protein
MELDQKSIAHGLHKATPMRRDDWLKDLTEIVLETSARSFFVSLAQADIADKICNKDSGKPAVHTYSPELPVARCSSENT